MKTLFFFILIAFISCSETKKSYKENFIKFYKMESVDSISFFGGVNFIKKDGKGKYDLFYRNDSLKYFSLNVKNRKSIFVVTLMNDSLVMLSKSSEGNYYSVDTIVFYKDKCVRKGVVYNYQHFKNQKLEITGIAKISYTTYLYGEKELKIYNESFFSSTIKKYHSNKSIFDYKILSDNKIIELGNRNFDSTVTKYENKIKHKYNFFY